jgi:hypothetical protein
MLMIAPCEGSGRVRESGREIMEYINGDHKNALVGKTHK